MDRKFFVPLYNPKLLLVGIFLVSFSLLSLIIYRFHTLEMEQERAKVYTTAVNYSYDIKFNLERALSSVHTLQALLSQNDNIAIRNFEEVVEDILPSYPGVIELAIAPDGVIAQVAPLCGNEKALGINLFELEAQKMRL